MPVDPKTIKVGDTVLSKVGSFPVWPAVVIPLKYVPEDVFAVKPKTKKPHYCVSFFNDQTFYWNTADTLTHLTKEYKIPKSKSRQIKKAFQDYEAYSGIEDFLRDKGLLAEDEDYSEGPIYDPEYGQAADDDHGDDDDAESDPVDKKVVKKRRTDIETKTETNGLDEETKKQKVLNFRSKLQRGLLQRKTPATDEELKVASTILEEVEQFSKNINTDLLRISKLQKVLKAITKVPELENPSGLEFHKRSATLLRLWEPNIIELKAEKERARTETPSLSLIETSSSKDTNGDSIEPEKPETSNGNPIKTEVKT